MGYQAKELRGFDSRDCQRCHEKAIALYLCCADCDKPLLRAGLSGRCRACQAHYEKLVARGFAGAAPTPEVLKQRRVAAAETAYEQMERKRERKAQAEYEADWRWRQGLTPARSARPGDPFTWLDQQVSDELFADALDERLFGDPSPLPPGVTAGRDLRPGSVRYTLCDGTLGYLGEVIIRRLDSDRIEYRANGVGMPDDPMRPARDALLLPLATTFQARLEAAVPIRPIPGVAYRRLATAPVYQPPQDVTVHLMGCTCCTQPILMLIHAATGHCLEDYARDLRPIYQEHTLPTLIAGPPSGDEEDDLPADVLPVWPERGERYLMEDAAFGDLLETLSQAHCPGQQVLTA